MPRYKCKVEYDGTAFCGWQRQGDALSVQQTLEEAIEKFCTEQVRIHTAGRTDAGVHATGQVIHFDLAQAYDTYKIHGGINFHARPQPVCVLSVEEVNEEFHARFSAKKRYYKYRIVNRRTPLIIDANRAWQVPLPLDVSAMKEAAAHLIGKHDFSSFRASECQAKSPIKTLDELRIEQNGEEIVFYLSAQSFLHHMVRIIVGSLEHVGSGRWTPQDIQKALAACDRRAGGRTAPAQGLYLTQVDY